MLIPEFQDPEFFFNDFVVSNSLKNIFACFSFELSEIKINLNVETILSGFIYSKIRTIQVMCYFN